MIDSDTDTRREAVHYLAHSGGAFTMCGRRRTAVAYVIAAPEVADGADCPACIRARRKGRDVPRPRWTGAKLLAAAGRARALGLERIALELEDGARGPLT